MSATSRIRAWAISSATALVLLGASIAPFLAPAYIRLEQDRVGVAGLTGYEPAQLDAIAESLIADLVLWQGDFDVAVDGAPVLSERERSHMRDVRGVFAGFFALVALGAVALAVAGRRATGSAGRRANGSAGRRTGAAEAEADAEARFALWRAVAAGARGLAIALALVGAFTLLAFEAAFEVFHRLFFSSGSYTFDPRTDRLVQLFPQGFWSDTATLVGIVALVFALVTMWQAGRRASRPSGSPVLAASKART